MSARRPRFKATGRVHCGCVCSRSHREIKIEAQCAPQLELCRQRAGGQRRGGGEAARCGRWRVVGGQEPSKDQVRHLAVVQDDRRHRSRWSDGVDEPIDSGSRRQHELAIAGQKWLGRLAVDGHHQDRMILDFQSNDIALAAVDDAKPQPLVAADVDVGRGSGVDGIKCCGILVRPLGGARRDLRCHPGAAASLRSGTARRGRPAQADLR